MRKSPTYSLIVDEVIDIASHNHLAIIARYIGPDSKIKIAFISDPRIGDGCAQTITDTIKEERVASNINLKDMSSVGSDGAAVLSGRKNGVWAKLKQENPSLITNHCKDHRLALACRDSYKSVKTMNKLHETLDNMHKYYKYSSIKTKSLEDIQKAMEQPVLKVKKAKHHRWLSYGKAVKSIVTSYRALICDLESHTISGDPVGNGILKSLKDQVILKTLLLLADVLPQMDQLSLFFQRRDIHLGMVKGIVDKTLQFLEKLKTDDGPWMRKMHSNATECGIETNTPPVTPFSTAVKKPFLSALICNIQTRFEDSDVMNQLALMDLSLFEEIPCTYGLSEMMDLADHFKIDSDNLVHEWTSFISFIGDTSADMYCMFYANKL